MEKSGFCKSAPVEQVNPPEKMQIIFDPAIQEWVDYRCQEMAGAALGQMAAYIRSLNPGGC